MRVCVIGAGPAGLTTIKQLLDEGHDVLCYEKNADIGGLWYRYAGDTSSTKAYDNLLLTVSMRMMSFSDFMSPGPRRFVGVSDYWGYLDAYARRFGLRRHIEFAATVGAVVPDGQGFAVTVEKGGTTANQRFDAVAVCTGPFQRPHADLPELAGFTGRIVHASRYRSSDAFAGQRVLIVGLAESGADVVREVARSARACTLAIRSYVFLLPRQSGGRFATDSTTFRAHHYEMWVRATPMPFPAKAIWGDDPTVQQAFLSAVATHGLAEAARYESRHPARPGGDTDPLGQPRSPRQMDVDTPHEQKYLDAINDWNRKAHRGESNWSQRAIFCKNVSFIPAIVDGQVRLNDTGVATADGARVWFGDGSSAEFDTVILCTGYRSDFGLLEGNRPPEGDVRNLYKHAFYPEHAGRLALIGLVRPFSGGLPAVAEMQARYFAALCSGWLTLPADVRGAIARDKAWEEAWTVFSPRRPYAIPSQIMYMDALAREIGCLMSAEELIRDPEMLLRHWFYSFNQSCYRIVGPHALGGSAREALLAEGLPSEDASLIRLFVELQGQPHTVHPRYIDIS